MKKLTLVAVLLLVVSALSFGQTVTVTATVNVAVSIGTDNNLAFGNVVVNVPKTIASTNSNAAAFTITGQANTSTVLTVGSLTTLTSGGNNLPFANATPVWNTTQSQTSTTDYTASTGGTATLNGSGHLYVYMGGTVTPASDQAPGNYSGSITLSVAYP